MNRFTSPHHRAYLAVITLAITLLSGCIKSPNAPSPPPSPSIFSLSEDAIIAYGNAAEKDITLTTNGHWTASSDKSWCALSATSGGSGRNTITLTVEANESSQSRVATVSFSLDKQRLQLTVDQYPTTHTTSIVVGSKDAQRVTSVQAAPLKYNKQMAYSFVAADGNNRPWSKLFCYMQGRYVNSGNAWHPNMQPTTDGVQPDRELSYTDGCCVERRYTMANSIVPIRDMQGAEYPYEKPNPDIYHNYLTWSEIGDMLDFDGSIQLHNIRDKGNYNSTGIFFDRNDPKQIAEGLEQVQQYIARHTGRRLKVLAIPDGNMKYATAAESMPELMMLTSESYSNDVNLATPIEFPLKRGIFIKDNFEQHKANFDSYYARCSESYYPWVLDVTHDVSPLFSGNVDPSARMLDYVCDTHGTGGQDDVWMATPDEICMYKWRCAHTTIRSTSSADALRLDLTLDMSDPDIYWSEITLLIEGLPYSPSLEFEMPHSVVGFSAGAYAKGTMININFDLSLLERAKRYTAKYLADKTAENRRNALYFVNRLSKYHAEPLLSALN